MFRQKFWMAHFGAPSMKRTILWSTSSIIGALQWFETMCRKDFSFDPNAKTTKRYQNRDGNQGYQGTSKLKESQNFG